MHYSQKKFRIIFNLLLFVIVFSPLLYLYTNPEWTYAPLSSSDSYWNQAYSFFFNISHYKTTFYKASRVPWLVFLFYLQKLTGPYLLTPLINTMAWLLQGWLYFEIIKRIFDASIAIKLIPWIVFFPNLVGMASGGGTYQNIGATILFQFAILFWHIKPLQGSWKAEFVGGVLIGSAIHIQLTYIHLCFLFFIFDISRATPITWKRYLWVFLGLLFCTLFWGAVNFLHGRPFLFFIPMYEAYVTYVADTANQSIWWRPFSSLFFLERGNGPQLMFHFAFLVLAIIFLLQKKKKIY